MLYYQLLLLGKIGRSPTDDPMRRNVFLADSATPVIGNSIRRVGRPRQDWTSHTLQEAQKLFPDHTAMESALLDASAGSEVRWRSKARKVLENP